MPPSDTRHTAYQLNIHITQYYSIIRSCIYWNNRSPHPTQTYHTTKHLPPKQPHNHTEIVIVCIKVCAFIPQLFSLLRIHTRKHTHNTLPNTYTSSAHTRHTIKNITFTLSVYKGTSLFKFINNFPPKSSPSAIFWVPLASFPSCSISGRWSDPIQTQ